MMKRQDHLAFPLIGFDEQNQHDCSGILDQIVDQGREIARCETLEIINKIQRRAEANNLNRGLRISLPYFDDKALEMKSLDFDVIPAGRIMFIPAFVVLAVRKERSKVAQDPQFTLSTRNNLLSELQMLESAFTTSGEEQHTK